MGKAERILGALHTVPEQYRVPLLLHQYAGYGLKDIAAALDTNVNTVKIRIYRGRAQLRQAYLA